jgi:hypothetical protein
LGHVVDKFFGGSKDALLAQLAAPPPVPLVRAAAAAASGSGAGVSVTASAAPISTASMSAAPAAGEPSQMGDPAVSDSMKS